MKTVLYALLLTPMWLLAQISDSNAQPGWSADPPDLTALVDFSKQDSDLRVAINRYIEDRKSIERRYEVRYSPARQQRIREFLEGWREQLQRLDFKALNHEGKIDYIALRNRIAYDVAMLDLDVEKGRQMASLLPFSDKLRLLQENRHDRMRVDPRETATVLDDVATQVDALTTKLNETAEDRTAEESDAAKVIARRTAVQVDHLREILQDWNAFYDGYDPDFNFWVRQPYQHVQSALENYRDALNLHVVGIQPGELPPIIGDPVLEGGLRAGLALEMIPYSAAELIKMGEREMRWIERQFELVAAEMGFDDDWKAALEHTKNLAPPPGEKAWVIFDIAKYSEEYIEKMGTVTLPPLAREIWRLKMQTAEQQLLNPFFSGGEVTRVSYPLESMSHKDKLMSMRGNTPHFNFGTVQHELLPGHYMQQFMADRFNKHRGMLSRSPFWTEGWAQYWEFQLWRTDFPRSNADRIGMLFWRMHRAARIVFSLNYQLGNWSPQRAIDFLVDRVGHERANAEAEVRRTTVYSPLYQIAYMTGAMQFDALYRELVESGEMTAIEFHDGVMRGGRLPVELVRARLTKQQMSPDFTSQWRFLDSDGR